MIIHSLNRRFRLRPGETVWRELIYIRAKSNSAWLDEHKSEENAEKRRSRGRKPHTVMDMEETWQRRKRSRSYRNPSVAQKKLFLTTYRDRENTKESHVTRDHSWTEFRRRRCDTVRFAATVREWTHPALWVNVCWTDLYWDSQWQEAAGSFRLSLISSGHRCSLMSSHRRRSHTVYMYHSMFRSGVPKLLLLQVSSLLRGRPGWDWLHSAAVPTAEAGHTSMWLICSCSLHVVCIKVWSDESFSMRRCCFTISWSGATMCRCFPAASHQSTKLITY